MGCSVSMNFFTQPGETMRRRRPALTRVAGRGSVGREQPGKKRQRDERRSLRRARRGQDRHPGGIRKAYKKIAKESHPDLNPGDAKAAARFKAAAAAYDLLKDPRSGARFDRGEIDAFRAGTPGAPGSTASMPRGRRRPITPRRGFEDFGDLSDVFADLFGRRMRGAAAAGQGVQMRGPDRHYALEVGFLEAAKGRRGGSPCRAARRST